MDYLNHKIKERMKTARLDFIYFLDISTLPEKQNRQLPTAIFMGLAINPAFVKEVIENPNFTPDLGDEYVRNEKRADELADDLAKFLVDSGYKAISQSDEALIVENAFDFEKKESFLPHKTIATMSGAGWIEKNNLFITPKNMAPPNLWALF